MNAIAVFCGSSPGNDSVFEETAVELGQLLAREKIKLVYGGAKVGLMGTVANAALEEGGEVVGVLPHFLSSKEIAHEALTELILVDSMHDRKLKMHDLCQGVIALPGGYGTLEEVFEFITWGQLGLHSKPTGVFNVNGFYDSLLTFLDETVQKGFLKRSNREMLLDSISCQDLLQQMKDYKPPQIAKWISKDEV
ncbi:MAG: TIGR00730 family Rossman fold protein [Bacteroidota bacterium]